MVVIIDEEGSRENISANRRFRTAPPVATSIGGNANDFDGPRRTGGNNDRRHLNAYDADAQRRGAGSGANVPNSANHFANFGGSNSNLHSSADAVDRRPSNSSLSGPLTSSREYPPIPSSQFNLHAVQQQLAQQRGRCRPTTIEFVSFGTVDLFARVPSDSLLPIQLTRGATAKPWFTARTERDQADRRCQLQRSRWTHRRSDDRAS
jgi:hypothetical protein